MENEFKLLIIYTASGYEIICEDGSPMEFIDGSQTKGIKDLKTAIKICTDHQYKFEVV